jgi:hypothetical protein
MNSNSVRRDSVEPNIDLHGKGAFKYGEFAMIRIGKQEMPLSPECEGGAEALGFNPIEFDGISLLQRQPMVSWCEQKRKALCDQKRKNEAGKMCFVVSSAGWHAKWPEVIGGLSQRSHAVIASSSLIIGPVGCPPLRPASPGWYQFQSDKSIPL